LFPGFAVEKGLHPSASKESLALASRKESRARHNEDFRAFVQAQKQLKHPPGSTSSANTHDTASTAAAAPNVPPVAKRPAFTPLSHHRASSGDGEDDEGSEHGSLASVSSYSVPSSESSPDKQQLAKQAPGGGLHIKVPHPHSHAHNHKIQPAAKATAVPRKDPVMKESASAGKLKAPVSAPSSHAQALRKGASSSSSVASAGSAVSARSSPSSAVSPRNAAGFNVEEYRSQRDAERREMRQLMADRKKQLQARRTDSQPATPLGAVGAEEEEDEGEDDRDAETEIAVLVPARPPTKPLVFTPSPQKEVDLSNLSLQYTMEVDVSHDQDHEQSRIFALLESGIQVAVTEEGDDVDLDEEAEALEQSFAQLLLDERAGCDELGLTAGNDLEYSVLIEQMQQILRKPTVKGMPHAPHKHAPPLPLLDSIAEEGTLPHTPSSAKGGKLSPGRALAGELMKEDDAEDEGEGQSSSNECAEGAEVEDPDEFEEEDLMILEEMDLDVEGEIHSRNGDNNDDAFADEDFNSEDERGDELGAEEGEEEYDDDDGFGCLAGEGEGGVVDYSASHDPFLLPLMPALLTADMALLDPATRIVAASAVHDDAQRPAYATPEKKTDAHHPHHLHQHLHPHDRSSAAAAGHDEAASRRLQIAELQEYLVEKLGSAKVSEALHLLTISTEATLLASQGAAGTGGGSPDRPDNYYDERDEELLNRIEDILGVDCLHYLDDMFMLLTLQ